MNVALIHFYLSNSKTDSYELYESLACDIEKNVYLTIVAYKFMRRYGNEFMSDYSTMMTRAKLV